MVVRAADTSFDLLGKRWTALIVKDLLRGPRRFREVLHSLVRINDKVLSQRLKELEESRVIDRQVFAEVPVRVEYRLTDKGRGLAGVIHAMEQWDSSWSVDGRGRQANGGHARAEASAPPAVPAAAPTAMAAASPASARPAASAPESGQAVAAFPAPPSVDATRQGTPSPAGTAQPAKLPFWKRIGL